MLASDFIPAPKSSVKRSLREALVQKWQAAWSNSTDGRFTYRFVPKVSLSSLQGSPLLNMFITGKGPFPSFLFYIGKADAPDCICGQYGDPLHYLWSCPLTAQFHLPRPAPENEDLYCKTFLDFPRNVRRVTSLVTWLASNESFLLPP